MEDTLNVLFVINSTTEKELQASKEILIQASRCKPVRLNLLYVQPKIPVCYFHIPAMMKLVKKSEENARQALKKAGELLDVSTNHQWVGTGNITFVSKQMASRLGVDYVMAGAKEQGKIHASNTVRNDKGEYQIETIAGLRSLCLATQSAEGG
ncbi:MAG: hypothetical protein ACE365_01425 [Gammaproteobacteria bacterium]